MSKLAAIELKAHLPAKDFELPEDKEWKMRDFVLVDPSGVLWRIAQDIE